MKWQNQNCISLSEHRAEIGFTVPELGGYPCNGKQQFIICCDLTRAPVYKYRRCRNKTKVAAKLERTIARAEVKVLSITECCYDH